MILLRKNTELQLKTNITVKKLDKKFNKISDELKDLNKKLSQVIKEKDEAWYKVNSIVFF